MSRRNAYRVVAEFEEAMAQYAGSRYAVAVDTCTAALFLCFQYRKHQIRQGKFEEPPHVSLPSRTFLGVPQALIHAGFTRLKFNRGKWWEQAEAYEVRPLNVIDAAITLRRDMFPQTAGDQLVCVSFQYRKPLAIGRGGMIFTDDLDAASWLRLARFFGRHPVPIEKDSGPEFIGWQAYMEPERAARGLTLLMTFPDEGGMMPNPSYPCVDKFKIFDPYRVS